MIFGSSGAGEALKIRPGSLSVDCDEQENAPLWGGDIPQLEAYDQL